jgi:hypothetical protein
MLTREDLHIAGKLTIFKTTLNGEIVEQVSNHNDITLSGRDLVASLFNRDKAGMQIGRVTKIHVGRAKDDFDAEQKQLGSKVGETPVANIETSTVMDGGGRKRILLRLTGELGEDDCNDALCEAGLFTDEGVMYNRVTFDTVTKSRQFKLTLVWEILF